MFLLLLSPQNYTFQPFAMPHWVVSFFLISLGIFVYLQNKKSSTHTAYLLVCLSAALWLIGDALIMSSKDPSVAWFWAHAVYVGITFIPPSMYLFSNAWLNLLHKNKNKVILAFLVGLIFIILFWSTPYYVIGYQKHFFGNFSRLGALSVIYLLYFFSISIAFFKDIFLQYCVEKDKLRKIHLRNVLFAFVIAFIGVVEFLPTYGISIYPIGGLTIFLYTYLIALTIIRYKLMDIETAFHKTFAWIVTRVALITPFILFYFFLTDKIFRYTNFVSFSLTLIYVLFASFIINLVQPYVDRFFKRGETNIEKTLEKFTNELVHLQGLNELAKRLINIISETLYVKDITFFIWNETNKEFSEFSHSINPNKKLLPRLNDKFIRWLTVNNCIVNVDFIEIDPLYEDIKEAAIQYFKRYLNLQLCIPLVLNANLLGIIHLGKKSNLKPYKGLDYHFLRQLKNQAVIALSNSILYQHIEEKVKERTQKLIEIQNQLVQAEKLATIGTLAGGVAHEINNPLTAILTNTQMLLLSKEFDEESLLMIEQATMRCKEIVLKLMTYAKKPQDSVRNNINCYEVITSTMSFLKFQLEQENIAILFEAQEKEYPVYANHNELEQVLTNLILNAKDAIKKVKKSGIIKIVLRKDKENVLFSVKDDGSGIPKNILPRIFDPFFTTKEVGKGLGLGLSICQAIIEKYNGTISVQTEENKGTIFTITLPLAQN